MTGIDVCLEATLVMLPAYLFSTVKMSVKRKFVVTSAFVFRCGYVAHSDT